jgi:DNA polymerase-1
VALLAPVLDERIDKAGLRRLLEQVELPLSSVLARMQAHGVALDVAYLDQMAEGVRDTMATLQARIYELADEEFNLNSPPQLRTILYEKLRLSPGKRTPKGQLSTDASVLEKLRDQHPIVDALLSWRELDKLNSTYLKPARSGPAGPREAPLSSTRTCRCPVRGELGRQIRRSFVPGSKEDVLLVADYSQIELRILAHLSGDEGLKAAFESGTDIHTATSARVFGLPEDQVDPATRSRPRRSTAARARLTPGARLASGDHPDEVESSSTPTSRASRRSATTLIARWRGPPPRGSPRRSSAAAGTSPSCRRPTRGCGTWDAGWP